MIGLDELRDRVLGRGLEGGTWTPLDYEAWLAADAMLAPPPQDGEMHPMMVFHATVRAVAYTIGELFELFDCPLEDGPMLGEMDLHQQRPLRVGETYAVQPTIVDVTRKEGRSGTFDLIATEFVVRGEDSEPAATLRNTYVCPRRA